MEGQNPDREVQRASNPGRATSDRPRRVPRHAVDAARAQLVAPSLLKVNKGQTSRPISKFPNRTRATAVLVPKHSTWSYSRSVLLGCFALGLRAEEESIATRVESSVSYQGDHGGHIPGRVGEEGKDMWSDGRPRQPQHGLHQ